MRVMKTRCEVRDYLLAEWGDWVDHDGGGIPAHLIGRRVMVHGLPSPDTGMIIELTPAYAASDAAAVWTWGEEDEGDFVWGYRVMRHEPLPFGAEALHRMDMIRSWQPPLPLMIGLDGEQPWW